MHTCIGLMLSVVAVAYLNGLVDHSLAATTGRMALRHHDVSGGAAARSRRDQRQHRVGGGWQGVGAGGDLRQELVKKVSAIHQLLVD